MKTLSILTKCIVDRSKWLRGEGYQSSFLLREGDGKQCCLGQFCLQAGATEEEIFGIEQPDGLVELLVPQLVQNGDVTDSTDRAMSTNDDPMLSDEYREMSLKETFLTFTPPVELEFIN